MESWSHFRESELTAEGQGHIKMTFSYEHNRNWQRLTLETRPQQITSHHIQIFYLQSMKTTVYYWRYMRFVTPLFFSFVYILQLGDDLWPHSWEGSEKSITKDFQLSHLI